MPLDDGMDACTGTSSTKVALEQIGFEPVHHMAEVVDNGEFATWIAAMQEPDKAKRHALLRKVLDKYKVTTDFPACMFYKDLMEVYPTPKCSSRAESR